MKESITPENACALIGGSYNKKRSTCSIKLDDPQDTCKMIGGNYDFDDETCDLPLQDPRLPGSILQGSTFAAYFSLQVITGAGTTILATWYTPTTLPPAWWASYVILAFVFSFTILMYYYRLLDWKEAIARAVLSFVIIAITSVITGWIYYWDITLYWGIVGFADLPIAATILGIAIAALLSIVLVDIEKRKDDNPSNEFSGGASLSVIG